MRTGSTRFRRSRSHRRAEPAQSVEERRDGAFAQALGTYDRHVAATERRERGAEASDRAGIARVDGPAGAMGPAAGSLNDELVALALHSVIEGDDGVGHRPHVVAWIERAEVQARAPFRDRR